MFPAKKSSNIALYFDEYANEVGKALASVDRALLEKAGKLLIETIRKDGQIFACGNGGSAAISNHLACDHSKGISTGTELRPRVQSLSASAEIITAVANDINYAEIFSYQLSRVARKGDLVIAISASGDSPNICEALRWARGNGLASIALTGFSGGAAMGIADIGVRVVAENYGVVEDVHQSLMHVLAQFIRMSAMDDRAIGQIKF
jgi:D-sedoheptulose 7-phosphate isomerase